MKILTYLKSNREKGSIAAVLAVAIVIATVSVILGAFSLSSSSTAENSESQLNMSSALTSTYQVIDKNIKVTGNPNIAVGQKFTYKQINTTVVVKSVTAQTVNGVPGSEIVLQAIWRDGVHTTTQNKLYSYPSNLTTGTITGFDSNGKAIWG